MASKATRKQQKHNRELYVSIPFVCLLVGCIHMSFRNCTAILETAAHGVVKGMRELKLIQSYLTKQRTVRTALALCM